MAIAGGGLRDDDEWRRFVGVGIDRYANFDPLEAIAEVQEIGGLLADRWGYDCITIEGIREDEGTRLKMALPLGGLPGGALVVLWAGHGEMTPEPALRLITSDAVRGDNPLWTAKLVAGQAARTSARQILLLFDTCFAGGGAIEAVQVANRLITELPDPKPLWVGVLASAQEYERARDGVFFAELKRLLTEGPQNQDLRARFNPFNRGVSGLDVLQAVVTEWTATGQRPVQVNTGVPEVMFPNPLWDPGSPELVAEHLVLASQGRSPEETGIFFTGRDLQLETIVEWFASPEPGVLVVTGPAGSGKSAIAGRIVSLSNPVERQKLLDAGEALGPDPGENSVHAHVQARRLTVDRVAQLLDEQLRRKGLLPPSDSPRNRHELLGALLRVDQRVTIVIDGLDEAESQAWPIANELIIPLGQMAHVLLATRELTRDDQSLIGLVATQPLIDLGDTRWAAQTVANVRDYVHRRLSGFSPAMDPSLVADYIVGLPAGRNQGLFLLARVITTQLRVDSVDTTDVGWESLLAVSVEQAFDRDLARVDSPPPAGGNPSSVAREVLAALSWGYGSGLPDDVWAEIATALSPSGTKYTTSDVYWVLTVAGRYVLIASGGDRAAYRLSHKLLADHLHPPRRQTDRLDRDPDTSRVAKAVIDFYRRLLDGGVSPESHRYLWLYAWQHCADAGGPGIELLRRLAADQPAFEPDLALALATLGVSYREAGRVAEAVPVAEDAVGLLRVLAEDHSYLPDLAAVLSDLGLYYRETGHLAEAVPAAEEAVNRLRVLADDSPAQLPALAMVLTNLGGCYREAGRLAEAVPVAEEAVKRARVLAGDSPTHWPGLAMALTNLGNFYREAGRLAEAVPVAEEAVERFRVLAGDSPAHLPGLGMALTNLGTFYREAGRGTEAVGVAEEAVERYRVLAGDNPANLPGLAMALANLGGCYRGEGRLAEAVPVVEDAVARYRVLAGDNPANLPGLAMALVNLGGCYRGEGRLAEAVPVFQEAVDRFRVLADGNLAHLPGLALALANLGGCYEAERRLAEAVPVVEEAVRYYRVLVVGNPAHLPGLAAALTNLGTFYQATGRLAEAVPVAEDAVARYRVLAGDNLAHLPGLAQALANLGTCYRATGRLAEAVPVAEDAVARYRVLAGGNPAHLPGLAMALTNQGTFYRDAGRLAEAVSVAEEAVERSRVLAGGDPAHLPGLGMALNNMGACYREAGRLAEAVPVAEEAVVRYRALADSNPALSPGLAMALNNLGAFYREAGRLAEAVPVAEEAVERFRVLAGGDPAHLPGLGMALTNLSGCYWDAGRLAEAVPVAEEARERYRVLAGDNPAHLPGLALALANLATFYREAGRAAEAVPIGEEAVQCYQVLAGDSPAHLPGLALALVNLGGCYEADGRLAEAVPVAEDAVARFRVLAGGNPAHWPGLAMALASLGTIYREAGRLAEAVPVAEDAVARYRVLANGNSAQLSGLALALTNLGTCYQATSRAGEADEIWEESLGPLATAAQITLLFHRALGRVTVAAAVHDLRRASTLIEVGDLAFTGELHDVARSCRAKGPSDFDNTWQQAAGEIPAWLVLDPDFLETVIGWFVTPSYSAACSFAIEHAAELLHGETDLALDELDLRIGEISATGHEHQIIAVARDSNFEEVYRPYIARELAARYLASDLDAQTRYLRDHERELLGNEEFKIALDQLGDEENSSHRSGIALVQLAESDLLEQALTAIGDQDQLAALVSRAALGNDVTPVRALGRLVLATSKDEPAVAFALFCEAIAAVLSAQTDIGADQLRDARRVHAATVQGLVPVLLQLTAIHPGLAVLAPVLGEPLPDLNDER